MSLIFERYRGHLMDRACCQFSMLEVDKDDPVRVLASWALMDDLDRSRGTQPHEREAQFERVKKRLTELASLKFKSLGQSARQQEILLTSKDLAAFP